MLDRRAEWPFNPAKFIYFSYLIHSDKGDIKDILFIWPRQWNEIDVVKLISKFSNVLLFCLKYKFCVHLLAA